MYIMTYSWYWEPSGFVAGLIHTYGSTTHYLKPISSNIFATNNRKTAFTYWKPYKDITTTKTFPCSDPNYGPTLIQYFSKLGSDRKAL